MTASLPSCAPMKPPLTGASTTSAPVCATSAASSGAVSGPIVAWMAMITGRPAAAATARTTSRTWPSSRTMTEMIPAAAAPSATLPAALAPASASGAIASGRVSYTIRPPGQAVSRVAIGVPIWPRPMNPAESITCLPPSRALGRGPRWLREAGPRRRDTATAPGAPHAAFGPAPAAGSPALTVLGPDEPELDQAYGDHDDEQDDPVQGARAELAKRESRLVDEELQGRGAVAGTAAGHHE